MRTILGIILAVLLAGSSLASVAEESHPAAAARTTIVYYFFNTFRCPTCKKIEACTREVVEESFADDLKSGRIAWHALNVDEEKHAHFKTDFKLDTKAVVLVDVRQGKQARWKNLEKIWDLIGTKDEFKKYIRDEITAYKNAE